MLYSLDPAGQTRSSWQATTSRAESVAVRVTRRALLKGLASLAACGPGAACTAGRRGRPIGGSIVGGAHHRGHLLRDGFRPRPDAWAETTVAVLGAGVAGLSAAWALERAGLTDYVVLELEDVAGGTARSGAGSVTPYPWGAHYVPVPSPENQALVTLLDEVGAVAGRDPQGRPEWAEDVLCRDPQERVFFRGEWYEGLYPRAGATPDDLAQLRAFEAEARRWARWRDDRGRRAFDVPRARGSDHPDLRALDRLSMASWLDGHGFNSARLRWLVAYGCRDDFGATLAQTSAWAGLHYFAARLDPASGEGAAFLTWPEGNGRLVRHLAQIAGARLRLGTMVTDVVPREKGVDVVAFEARGERAWGLHARHVVFALPRFLASRLVSPWRQAPPAHLDATEYGSWMVANLTLRGRPTSRGFGLAWDNVLYDSPSLGYVVATHQSGRDDGPTVLTYYLPFLDDDPRLGRRRLLATSWDEWVARILADLERAHAGLHDLVETVDVYLWGHAMVRPRPGFLWSEALAASARPLGRIRFAHTDLSGMALFEEAQYWGLRAAASILEAEGRKPPAWLA
jgi:protoporphyrinogen oxidase